MQIMEKIWRYNKDEGSRCGGEPIFGFQAIRMLYKDFLLENLKGRSDDVVQEWEIPSDEMNYGK